VLSGSLRWSFSARGGPCFAGGARKEVRMQVDLDLDCAARADGVMEAAESCPQDAVLVGGD